MHVQMHMHMHMQVYKVAKICQISQLQHCMFGNQRKLLGLVYLN
jgi:hypothetical protein